MKFWIPKLNYYSKRLSMWQEKLWRDVNGNPFMGILDNVAGRKTFEYAHFGTSGIQQSNSKLFGLKPEKADIMQMSASVWTHNYAAADTGLTTTMDRGRDEFDQTPGTGAHPCYAYGYNISGEGYIAALASFGTMASATYTDGSSLTQVIKGCYHTDPCGGANDDVFFFSLDTTSEANTDATWLDITWDDTAGTPRTVDRSADASTYTASLNGSTHWRDTAADWDWTDLDAGTDFVLTTS